ncbi:TetR/AcrR family transcriptional regulator [Methylobacter sp. Wu8]|uniref:TetR/AcrR family transcriptional regulator n=1 Tax=Methylobacter sp. Wu8 TaxID=3118457 RepID=UPI002F2C5E24
MARNLQKHILQIASGLFYSQGIRATGVDAIVKAAGTTKMSLYKYFPSKHDLVLAYLHKNREAFGVRISAGIYAHADSPKQKMLAIFDVFDEPQSSPKFRGCPFINASAEFAENAHPIRQATAEFSESFVQLLADLAREAGANDAEQLANQLAMLIAGAIAKEQMQQQSGAMRSARAAAEILIAHSLTG